LTVPVIDRLTEEQIAKLAEFRDRWIAIGLSTEPADRERAERAIGEMYRAAELRPPAVIEWCCSPQGMFDRAIDGSLVTDALWGQPGSRVWHHLKALIATDALLPVRVTADLVQQAVWDRVGHLVRRALRPSSESGAIVGQGGAGSLMFYDFFGRACGLQAEVAVLGGLLELAQSAGWALPYAIACCVSERPSALHRDDRGRLHSLTGPAIVYPDGWSIHAVHGVRVPREIVEDASSITVERIEAETNSEIRRVMTLKYGAARYLQESGAKLVNESKRGKLWRRDRKGDDPLVMVEVQNSTPEPDNSFKTYFLRVPPHIKTAAAAVAWRFGFEAVRDYHPAIQT
jgi:hypothetical protein